MRALGERIDFIKESRRNRFAVSGFTNAAGRKKMPAAHRAASMPVNPLSFKAAFYNKSL
jgi:hypothetical protein